MLPLTYTLRNLLRAPGRSLQMIFGAALVVAMIISAMAFNKGMESSLNASADNNAIILASGSEESVERSEVSASTPSIIRAEIESLVEEFGQTAVSGEVHYNGFVKIGEETFEGLIRGVTLPALQVHKKVEIIEGHFPNSGEVLVGVSVAKQLGMEGTLRLGQKIVFEKQELTISGFFIAPGSVMEGEVWMRTDDLMTLTKRETLSCVVVGLKDGDTFDELELFTLQNLSLELAIMRETEYYKNLSLFYKPIKWMTWVTAILIASGAILGGINIMFAAFISRRKELATLQAVGYSRIALFISMLQEALLITFTGALLAMVICILVFADLKIAFTTGVFSLQFDYDLLIAAAVTSVSLALVGTLIPAAKCLLPALSKSLRVS